MTRQPALQSTKGHRTLSLGGGLRVPYPQVDARRAQMHGNRRRDTRPEIRLRSALHRTGRRFRVDTRIVLVDLSVRADLLFPRARVAVFVDGCFWHRCPQHGNRPRRNQEYWGPKLDRNVQRDRKADACLEAAGWRVVRIWEHEATSEAVKRVPQAIERCAS